MVLIKTYGTCYNKNSNLLFVMYKGLRARQKEEKGLERWLRMGTMGRNEGGKEWGGRFEQNTYVNV